jgi:translation elongation factor EF-G
VPESDLAIFAIDPSAGIDQVTIDLWQSLDEYQVPRLVVVTHLEKLEADFDDAVMIATRVFDQMITPYLVLHDEAGIPAALISLYDQQIIDYSTNPKTIKSSGVIEYENSKIFKEIVKRPDTYINIITEYNLKFQVIQTNLITLNGLTDNLKKSIDEKDVKINSLVNEKTALENDAKALRNTIIKMTAELAELGGELSKAKSENDENKLLSRINELTQERNTLTAELKKYQLAIELLKKENLDLATKMRSSVNEKGYTYTTKVEEPRKFGEVLVKLNIRDGGTTIELINESTDSKSKTEELKSEKKSDSKVSKKGFWSKILAPQTK